MSSALVIFYFFLFVFTIMIGELFNLPSYWQNQIFHVLIIIYRLSTSILNKFFAVYETSTKKSYTCPNIITKIYLLLIIQIGLYRENSKGLVLSISYSFFYCQNYNISSSSGFHQSIVYYCNISNFIQAVSDNIIADYFSVT